MKFLLLYPLLVICKILAIMLGFIAVALALPFSKVDKAPELPKGVKRTVFEGWEYERLPKWADWLWGNDKYGAQGNWFWPDYHDVKSFKGKYIWLALRNAANNLNRYSLFRYETDASTFKVFGTNRVNDVEGLAGCQLVSSGWRYGLYCILPYGKRSLRIRLGYKFDPQKKGIQSASLSVLINPFARFGS